MSWNDEKEEMNIRCEEPHEDLPEEMRVIKNHPKD